jgi:hypothetical protein
LGSFLYWCGNPSLTLREEHRMKTLENTALKKTFWPKRNDVKGERRRGNYTMKSFMNSNPD